MENAIHLTPLLKIVLCLIIIFLPIGGFIVGKWHDEKINFALGSIILFFVATLTVLAVMLLMIIKT